MRGAMEPQGLHYSSPNIFLWRRLPAWSSGPQQQHLTTFWAPCMVFQPPPPQALAQYDSCDSYARKLTVNHCIFSSQCIKNQVKSITVHFFEPILRNWLQEKTCDLIAVKTRGKRNRFNLAGSAQRAPMNLTVWLYTYLNTDLHWYKVLGKCACSCSPHHLDIHR